MVPLQSRWTVLAITVGTALAVGSTIVPSVEAHRVDSVRRSDGAAATAGLLVVEYSGKVTVMSLAGKRFPVPARVREAPLGLSPDARQVAEARGGALLVGAAAGGPMRTIVTGNCASTDCPYGPDPSFAWSPDSRRLAVAVNLPRPPTRLRLVDRTGHQVRSYKLPEQNADRGGRAYFHIVSWSPDGSRLLLIRKDPYIDTGVVALDVATGRLRTLARIEESHDSPSTLSWSPNSRFIVLTSEGRSERDYAYAVIDASTALPILQCKASPPKGCVGGSVWAPDSKSLFGTTGVALSASTKTPGRIERFYLSGRRTQLIASPRYWLNPRAAVAESLIYEEYAETPSYTVARDVLCRYDLKTRHRSVLLSSKSGIRAVLSMGRLP